MDNLLKELNKLNDSLSDLQFTIGKTTFKIHYRYLTILEKMRVEQACVKRVTTMGEDGTTTTTFERQPHLFPIHLILEKALDKDGKRIYSHVKKDDFTLISRLPHQLLDYIANEMQIDVFGNLNEK